MRKKVKLPSFPCQVCSNEFTDTRRKRRYCSKTCRKTAEIRRYRFKKRHGIQFEDVVPKDGNWFSDIDATMADVLRAHQSTLDQEPIPNNVSRKRKGRPPIVKVVRSDGKINHMALRDQAFDLVVRGKARIDGHRRKARIRKALLKAKTRSAVPH